MLKVRQSIETGLFVALTGRGEYDQFNPRVGLLVDAAEDIQFFGNISRSFEAPGGRISGAINRALILEGL